MLFFYVAGKGVCFATYGTAKANREPEYSYMYFEKTDSSTDEIIKNCGRYETKFAQVGKCELRENTYLRYAWSRVRVH